MPDFDKAEVEQTLFLCGHPRTPENTINDSYMMCRICFEERRRSQYKDTLPCGHPKEGNKVKNSKMLCRTCLEERALSRKLYRDYKKGTPQ